MKFWMAPSGLHIEPGATDDAKQIAQLHAQGFAMGWPQSEFSAYLRDVRTTPTYIACDAKRRIAGFALIRIAADEAELLSISVGKKARGQGLGGALMAAIEDDLLMSPVKTLFLEVEDGNESALRLYRGRGFAEIGTRKAYYPKPDGTAAKALVMSLQLG